MPGAVRLSRSRVYQLSHPDRLPSSTQKRAYDRKHHLSSKYGITPADYEAILESQGRRCAICRTDKPGGRSGVFHVDHAHGSGRVRGLLCAKCNLGLGSLGEDPQILRNAIEYLIWTAIRKTA